MGNEPHGERIAALEARMKNVEKAQETIFAKLDEQTKQIYKAIGMGVAATGLITALVQVALAIFKH